MGKFIDLTGKKFFRWTVIKYLGRINNRTRWMCICNCGTKKIVQGYTLTIGQSKSCGCYHYEVVKINHTTHGGSKTPEYNNWVSMKMRCYSVNNKKYPMYGGKGITVCKEWLNSFETFLKDMGKRPTPLHSLDRFPNKYGNYEPQNCRWATQKEQQNNRTNNVWLEYNGEKKVRECWAIQFGISSGNLIRFINNNSFKEAYIFYMNKKSKKQLQHNI